MAFVVSQTVELQQTFLDTWASVYLSSGRADHRACGDARPALLQRMDSPMPKKKSTRNRRHERRGPGRTARAKSHTLRSYTVGAAPIINRLLDRMQLERILKEHLPPDGPRTKLPTRKGLLLLLRNFLFSRDPIYGVGEWADGYAADLVGLTQTEREYTSDDGLGRCLDRLFMSNQGELVLAAVRHVIKEFGLRLDELHNDSTTISFFGAYDQAGRESSQRGQPTLAITYGHNKDHRPDLKQLLYVLTVTEDGGVPVYFTTKSGNVTDDTTHQETWDLLCQLVGRVDFLYVADCKLATMENMNYIHHRGGRINQRSSGHPQGRPRVSPAPGQRDRSAAVGVDPRHPG